MKNDDKVEPDYLKGFNEGYTIAQHMPELAEQLASIDSDFIRLVGFKDGHKQYETDQIKERLPSWLKGERNSKEQGSPSKSKNRHIEPGKD